MRSRKRWKTPAALMLAVAVSTAACGGAGIATTDGTVTTVTQDVVVEESPVNDAVPDPQPGDAEITLAWTEAELSGDTYIDQLIVTPEGFIAYRTDEGARAWVSQDGITWSEADLDFGTAENAEFYGVTTGGTGYLALGSTSDQDQMLWTCEEGLSWEPHPFDLDIPPGEFEGFDSVVSFDGGLLLRGSYVTRDEDEGHGHSVLLAYSEDGISWKVLPDHEILFGPGAQVGQIISTGSGLIATGYVEEEGGGERFWFSLDGRSWDQSSPDFLNGPGFYLGPDTVRWGDAVLIVSNSDEGISLHTSVDGRDWEDLSPSPLMEHTEEFSVCVQQVAAGPFGIAIIAQYEPAQQTLPAVTVEKDGVAVTIHFESGVIAVADLATGDPDFRDQRRRRGLDKDRR